MSSPLSQIPPIPTIPQIPCPSQNHYSMPLQYICLHPQCLKNSQQLACLYCCQQLHKDHIQHIHALKMVLAQFRGMLKPTEFGVGGVLLAGVGRCRTGGELRGNLGELVGYCFGGERFQRIVDRRNQVQKLETKDFYENRNKKQQEQQQKTVKKNKKQPLQTSTAFITPILTFSAEDATEQGFQLKSPFCIVNPTQKLITAFAYPPLNRFDESIELSIKIQRITPFWLGLGLSFTKKKYSPQSKQHIILTSNGWISSLGTLIRSQVKYCLKDTVKIKLDKRMQLLEFVANGEKHTVACELKWNQDVYLCCVLFYEGDSVQIMA